MTIVTHQSGRPDLSHVTALVIDRDVASIKLLEACLVPFGAAVMPARSAAEGKHLVEACVPDILICDLVLPPDSGLGLVRSLRARPPERGGTIPTIAVTSAYERFSIRETRAAGFDMFVRKPIDPMDIVHAVSILVKPQP